MAIQGTFFGLPVATLTTMLAQAQTAFTALMTTGQSYQIGGRSLTRANIESLKTTIQELQYAINRANGTNTTTTFANMNNQSGSAPNPPFAATAPGG